MKSLAAYELGKPGEALVVMKLGDGWWDIGEAAGGIVRQNARRHAALWYGQCVDRLSGLNRTKVARRLADVQSVGMKGTWVDVDDPKDFGAAGKPGDPIELIPEVDKTKVVLLDKFPTGEFDGVSVRVRVGTDRNVHAVLVFEKTGRSFMIDASLDRLVAEHYEANRWTQDDACPGSPQDAYVLAVLIEAGEYVMCVDGRRKLRVRTDASSITFVCLKADLGRVTFDQVRLRRKQ